MSFVSSSFLQAQDFYSEDKKQSIMPLPAHAVLKKPGFKGRRPLMFLGFDS